MSDKEYMSMHSILLLYEYIQLHLIGNGAYHEFASREMTKDNVDLKERFNVIMSRFELELRDLKLGTGDRDTCDLIVYSFNENGVSDAFYDDVKSALLTNAKVIAALKDSPLKNVFSKNPVNASSGSQV